jgi:hypothetical protein
MSLTYLHVMHMSTCAKDRVATGPRFGYIDGDYTALKTHVEDERVMFRDVRRAEPVMERR